MIVLTLGTFDLFHVGHANLLRRCHNLAAGGRVIVALNQDAFVERFKGHRPFMSYAERESALDACRWVDAVIPNIGDEDARPAIVAAKPEVIAIGSDWFVRDYLGQLGITQEWLDERGIRIVYLPYTETLSTTAIRERIA